MPEFTLQDYIQNAVKNKLVYEAGGSLLIFDKAAGKATHRDYEGNNTDFDQNSSDNYLVNYANEGTTFQKNTIKIIDKQNNVVTTHVQLTDPTEAFY